VLLTWSICGSSCIALRAVVAIHVLLFDVSCTPIHVYVLRPSSATKIGHLRLYMYCSFDMCHVPLYMYRYRGTKSIALVPLYMYSS